jgi:hypothetical protein
MPSAEIKALCVTALRNQMTALEAHEGADVPLMMVLRKELNEV